MSAVAFALRGRVAVLRICKPPVNSLGLAVRQGLFDGLDRAAAEKAGAIVIAGDGATFPAGADIKEFSTGAAMTEPILTDVLAKLDAIKVPTIAAVHGTALGGGMELALACHYRLLHHAARFGLPEVHLGILPGAGGTQRLPRLVGCEKAIQMMTTGAMIKADAALAAGLCDAVIKAPNDPVSTSEAIIDSAVAFAESEGLCDKGVDPSRIVSLRPVPSPPGGASVFFPAAKEAVKAKARGEVAPLAIVDAVEAAVANDGDFAAGMEAERELFMGLAIGEQSKALQQVFLSERLISKVEGASPAVKPQRVSKAAVIGAGTMGGGIAMCFADAGINVTLVDQSSEAVERGLKIITSNYAATAKKGKLSEEEMGKRVGRIRTAVGFADDGVSDADVVVEAAFESLEVKHSIFKELDAVCKPSCLLATNTSTLDIGAIAEAVKQPERVVGMHFFSPANVMPLLENVRSDSSSDMAIATAMDLGKRLRKKTVLARSCFGFIGNRMLEPYMHEALFLVEEGATPQAVDAVMKEFGLAMGPYTMSDLAGNDIGYSVRKGLGWLEEATRPDTARRYWGTLADALVEKGRLGQKTKKGWYDYSAGRKPVVDPEVEALIATHVESLGLLKARGGSPPGPDEIMDRLMLPLVNEGFKIVEEGIAQRESDVNIVYLYGYGFPRKSGGPMHWARHVRKGGLPQMVEDMKKLAAANPTVPHWQPSELLVKEAEKAAAKSKL